MAVLTVVPVDPDDTRVVHEPLIRINLDGGCSAPPCGCSDEPFIFIGDGKIGLSVTLTPDDVRRIKSGIFEDYPDVEYDS